MITRRTMRSVRRSALLAVLSVGASSSFASAQQVQLPSYQSTLRETGRGAARDPQGYFRLAAVEIHEGQTQNFATPDVLRWLEKLIRENLPPNYEDDRKWNQQKEVWNGIEFRREGLKVETKRKKKLVNAGTWTKYSITLVEPEKNLVIQFQRLESLPDGRIAFAVSVDCSLDIFGRLSQWARDVQLISISANADAACRLTLEGTVQFQMNPLTFPPDIRLRPHVDVAHVDLTYYRVRRISQVGGDFAKVLGNGLRGTVDDKLEDMNAKLVDKINAQLTKHEDKLSFSAQDWLRSKFLSGQMLSKPQ